MVEYKDEWLQAYFCDNVDNEDYDPHTVFSELTGLDRHDAKQLAYKNMFQKDTPYIVSKLMKMYKDDLEDSYLAEKELSGYELTRREFYGLINRYEEKRDER